MTPAVSVVVVADYGATLASVHADLRSSLTGLASQDFKEPAEFILVESADRVAQLPAELTELVPSLRVLAVDSTRSYDLKTAGARAAAAEFIVLLDADCTPAPQWLRTAVQHLREHPDVSVVTGRIVYADQRLPSRALALLSRAHSDRSRIARARFISNANGAYRRDVLHRYPLCADAGPFSGLLQSEAMWRDGVRAHFDPDMKVVHAFEGWPMERDIRRQIGYSTIDVRRRDPAMRFAWLARLGMFSIPVFAILRMFDSWWNCCRSARAYGIRWWELPATFGFAAMVHAVEVGGMWRAFRQQPSHATHYR